MPLESFAGVRAATGDEAASGAEKRADETLVHPDQQDERLCCPGGHGVISAVSGDAPGLRRAHCPARETTRPPLPARLGRRCEYLGVTRRVFAEQGAAGAAALCSGRPLYPRLGRRQSLPGRASPALRRCGKSGPPGVVPRVGGRVVSLLGTPCGNEAGPMREASRMRRRVEGWIHAPTPTARGALCVDERPR